MSLWCFLPGGKSLKPLAVHSSILGWGEPVNHSSEAVFWNRSAEHLSHQSCVDRGGRNLTTWLQARDAGLQIDHGLQDAAPQPRGPSCSLRLASSPSELSVLLERPLRSSCCRRGGGFWFAGLGFGLTLDS